MASQLRQGSARILPNGVALALLAGAATVTTGFAVSPAWAGLEICNHTDVHRSVAIGYAKDSEWVSEGWWNLDPGQCATPVAGDLGQRYYYYRAETEDGSFPGEGYTFCTEPGAFTIVGDEGCEDRGYTTEDFREIDTGEVATTFAHAITDVALASGEFDANAADAVTGPAESGLHLCNRTDVDRNVAIGYSKDDMWTSEGWWTLEPGQCATPIEGVLTQRYYYFRAEDPGEFYEGEGYTFCAVDDAFTIVGDENCEDRGYETLSFSEIDTGPEALGYVFVLDADTLSPMDIEAGSAAGTPDSDTDTGRDTSSGSIDAGLRICNESSVSRFLAIGYLKDDQWMSEGWWHLDRGQCATPIEGDLTQRFYYYRAEDPDERFEGAGTTFCTIDDAFTILGNEDCEGRGYEEHAFSEIDTGPEALGYVFVIDQDGGEASPADEADVGEADVGEAGADETDAGALARPDPALNAADSAPATPSQGLQDGTNGRGIDITGVFLGCDVDAGVTVCTIRAADGRHVISYSDAAQAVVETFRGLTPSQHVRVQGAILAEGDTSVEVLAKTVTPLGSGDDAAENTRHGVQGGWRSLDDPLASIRFEDDRYYDYYQGELTAEGTYAVAMTCPDTPGSGGEDPVLVVRVSGEDAPVCYSVMYMDGTSLEMLALPRGNLLRYRRSD